MLCLGWFGPSLRWSHSGHLGETWSSSEFPCWRTPPSSQGPGSGCTPSAGKGGGGLEAVAQRVAVLIEDSTLLAREGPHGPCGGLGGPQGGLDREVACSAVLEGEKEDVGSGSIPARQMAGKTIGGRVLLRLNAKVCGFR